MWLDVWGKLGMVISSQLFHSFLIKQHFRIICLVIDELSRERNKVADRMTLLISTKKKKKMGLFDIALKSLKNIFSI